jgi:hypothetical protein
LNIRDIHLKEETYVHLLYQHIVNEYIEI